MFATRAGGAREVEEIADNFTEGDESTIEEIVIDLIKLLEARQRMIILSIHLSNWLY